MRLLEQFFGELSCDCLWFCLSEVEAGQELAQEWAFWFCWEIYVQLSPRSLAVGLSCCQRLLVFFFSVPHSLRRI